MLIGVSLAARVTKPPGSRCFDPMCFGIERYPPPFSAYKHGHGDGQTCRRNRQRRTHVTHRPPQSLQTVIVIGGTASLIDDCPTNRT